MRGQKHPQEIVSAAAARVKRETRLSLLLGLLLLRCLFGRSVTLRLYVLVVNSHGLIDLGAKSAVVLNPTMND